MNLKGFRTIIVNGVVAIASGAVGFMPMLLNQDWGSLGFNPTLAARVAFFLSIANIGLRMITTTPPGKA